MTKTSEDALVKEVGVHLFTFLKYGDISSFTKKIDTSLNIDDMEKLLRIHFILRNDVTNFVSSLPQRIRRIKTTTRKYNEQQRDKIRGRIDWQKTFKERYRSNDALSPYYVDLVERKYSIPENLVLNELLKTIYSITSNDVYRAIKNDYPWLKGWTKGNLLAILKNVYQRNIYLRRIREEGEVILTERMISNTLQSRNTFYSEAAKLMSDYKKLMNYDLTPSEAQELLKNTFIRPGRVEVLFELFWIFKVIMAITHDKKAVTFNIIDGNNNIVAEWEDEYYRYRIYHDSTGVFNFREKWENIKIPEKDGYLKRESLVVKEWQKASKEFFDLQRGDVLWGGRPDIVLEKYHKGQKRPVQVFLGEVKYTESVYYASKGLKELLEYMALIRSSDNYFEDDANAVFSSDKIKGWLFLDNVDVVRQHSQNVSVIKIGDGNIEGLIKSTCSN